jgi:hypothetical protein
MSAEPEPKTELTVEEVKEDCRKSGEVIRAIRIYRGNTAVEPCATPKPGDPENFDEEEF